MSNIGGVFTLITNTGIQDKLILGTDKLEEIIRRISKQKVIELRARNPHRTEEDIIENSDDWIPSLASIERSHIVFVNATFKPYVSIAHEYSKTGAKGIPKLGQTVTFTMPVYGEFVNDAVVHLQLDGFRAIDAANKVRYVEYVGHRVMKNVRFKLNEITLDEYTADRYNIHWQFKVPTNKEVAYQRCVGQEIPKPGYLTASPTLDEVREYRMLGDGPQTFKNVQPKLDLWIPLLFWFKDVHSALPNFLFPYGQTNVEIDFEDEANLVAFANYGLTPSPIYTPPVISKCELYVNHIFLHQAVHQIFMKRFGFQLVRVSRTHRENGITENAGRIRLHQLKWPVECMYIAFRPNANLAFSQRWHRNSAITQSNYPVAVVVPPNVIQVNNITYITEEPVISSLGLSINDIAIYQDLPPTFYNSYIPSQYGQHLKSPRDIGWHMMNFNLYPNEYQPSGYINSSNGREMYLSYESAIDPNIDEPYIRDANPVELIVVADCINFLLVKNNAAVLRFAT